MSSIQHTQLSEKKLVLAKREVTSKGKLDWVYIPWIIPADLNNLFFKLCCQYLNPEFHIQGEEYGGYDFYILPPRTSKERLQNLDFNSLSMFSISDREVQSILNELLKKKSSIGDSVFSPSDRVSLSQFFTNVSKRNEAEREEKRKQRKRDKLDPNDPFDRIILQLLES